MSTDVGMVLVVQHAVPEFDSWYKQYKCLKTNASKKMETQLGIAKSVITKLIEPNKDGKPVAQVLHFFTKDKLEAVKKQFTFTGPPFVGGLDLIKNGFIIPPIKSYYAVITAEITYDVIIDTKEPLSMCVGSCGVPDYGKWYQEFRALEEHTRAHGIYSSTVGKRVDKNERGKDQCFVAHVFKTSRVADLEKTLRYDAPPFVGGEDLIKNGKIIPPIDFELSTLIGQSYQFAETKSVLLPRTKKGYYTHT